MIRDCVRVRRYTSLSSVDLHAYSDFILLHPVVINTKRYQKLPKSAFGSFQLGLGLVSLNNMQFMEPNWSRKTE